MCRGDEDNFKSGKGMHVGRFCLLPSLVTGHSQLVRQLEVAVIMTVKHTA